MEYKEKKYDKTNHLIDEYCYFVEFDKERLLKILERLKNYRYISSDTIKLARDKKLLGLIGKDTIEERVISYFNNQKIHSNDKIYPETINYNKNDTGGPAVIEYSFEKVPDLYHYVDIIINNKDIINYVDLFGIYLQARARIDMSYAIENRDQVLLNGILDYIDSEELDNENSNRKYDHKELYKLYKETLECFSFRLITIKKHYLNTMEATNGLSFQRKLYKDHDRLQ